MRELDGHLTLSISLTSFDSRVLDRSSRRTIRCLQDDRSIDTRGVTPREFQELRLVGRGVREEDLVVLLYFFLASAYVNPLEVAGYSPDIFVRHCLAIDGRDIEIIIILVESSERFNWFRFRWRGTLMRRLTYPSKSNFKLETFLASSSAVVHVGPAQGF